MKRTPRRPDEPLLSGVLVWRIAFISSVLLFGVFGIFRWLRGQGTDVETARTAAVNTLVLFEVFYLFNVRKLRASPFSDLFSREARIAWAAAGTVIFFQLLFTYAPFMQWLFSTRPVELSVWAASVGVAATIFLLVEVEKALLRRLAKLA